MVLDVAGLGRAIAGVAGDENVGVEEAVRGVDLNLHVGDEGLAGGAAQMGMQRSKHIARHRSVHIRRAAHGEDFAIDILVAEGLVVLPGQILIGPERDFGLGQAHGIPR